MDGSRLKLARELAKMTQTELATALKVTQNSIWRWEKNIAEPDDKRKNEIAKILGVSVTFLMGENDSSLILVNGRLVEHTRKILDMTISELSETTGIAIDKLKAIEENNGFLDGEQFFKLAFALKIPPNVLRKKSLITRQEDEVKNLFFVQNEHHKNFIEIPLLSMEAVASCGVGNGLSGVEPQTTETIFIEQSDLQRYDDLRKPFAIHTEGDSMEGAGLEEGSVAVINPAEDVISGDMALVVCWFVKWVVWNPDGSVELRSANPNYATITVDKEYASDANWFRVVGKVVSIIKRSKPRRAF